MAKFKIKPALEFLLAQDRADLTTRQLFVLIACKKAPQTVRGLAHVMGVHKPVVTRVADKLEEIKFLQRSEDPTDKRSIFLSLTPAGAAFAADFS